MQNIMKSRVYIIVSMLIFGSIGVFVKNIPLTSGQTALARGIIGSLFLFGASILQRKKINSKAIQKNIWLLLFSGAAIGFNWIFLFQAYKYTTISNATLSYYFAPVFVTLLSPFLLKEKFTAKKIICICIAMTGMFFVADVTGAQGGASSHLLGIGYGLAAAGLYASVILMNKFLKGLSGMEATLIQLVMASIVLLPYILLTETIKIHTLKPSELLILLILGIFHTGFAYLLYFTSMQNLEGHTIAVYSYIDPISAILISAIFLAEGISFWQVIGGILVLGSTFISEKN